MRKAIILLSFILVATSINAQKFAFVDSEYILSNIPAYKSAQQKLDNYSSQWQKEVEQKYAEIESLYKQFQADVVFYSDDMKAKKENEIIEKERAVKQLQKKYFGPEGDLFKKRQELVKPIQDEIYNAIKDISNEGSYAVIFDTADGLSMLYTNPKYDLSDEVLQKLGYKN